MSTVSMGGCSASMLAGMQTARPSATDRAQQLFSKLDTDGDGAIGKSELQSFVDTIAGKTGADSQDAGSLLTSLDTDGNGSISSAELSENGKTLFDHLREQLMTSLESRPPPPDAAALFGKMDSDGDGSLSKAEFEAMLQQRPQRLDIAA